MIANTRTRKQKTSGHDVRGPLRNEMFGVGINSGPILSCHSHGLHTGRITTDANEKTTAQETYSGRASPIAGKAMCPPRCSE